MKHWRHYLEGAKHPVRILSDHKNLEVFMSTKLLNRRQARWAEFLSGYDFVLVHIPGSKNPADGPSRRPDYAEGVEVPSGTLIPRSALRMLPEHVLPPSPSSPPRTVNTIAIAQVWNLHGVNLFVPESQLRQRILDSLPEDPIAKQQRQPTSTFWSWSDGLLLYKNLMYVPESLRLEVLRQHHDDPLAGHFGVAKTLELLSRNYYFPGMSKFVTDYVSTCDLCARGKPSRHRPYGELAPLPVPNSPWAGVSCDFVVDLPVSEGYDALLVFVDRFTKMCHLVPCNKTAKAPDFARYYLQHVIRLHGIPESLVSDRGSIFTSHFWRDLAKLLGTKSRLSTSFHPQTDGQTERMNQTIEQYLRIYCNYQQDNWVSLLPVAEFAYNNVAQDSTGCSPFYANYGYHPRFSVDLKNSRLSVPSAREYAERLRILHDELIEHVKAAQNQHARYYDAKHQRIEFEVGNKVWLLSPNIRTQRPSKKLDWKRLGPFAITERIGTQAYRLQLPASMKIHPVFHVSLLERHKSSFIPGRTQPPPPPVVVDNEEEFEVEDILDSKRLRRCLFYLIKWKGFPASETSWEPASNVTNCPDLVQRFHSRYPDKPNASST
jgi:hypothetical protein